MYAVDPGYRTYGHGPLRVLVLHDWFCDSSGWEPVLPYLTPDRFTFVFADLRGYGRSRDVAGDCTLDEAAGDAIALADRLGWEKFSLVGHSMSGLVVQRIAQLAPERIQRIVAVTPVGPGGGGLDEGTREFFRGIALATDEERFAALAPMWGARLSETWIRYKLRRWRETAAPAAAAKYVALWGASAIAPGPAIDVPLLAIAGDEDAPWFRAEALRSSLLPRYLNATLVSLPGCGHYPMQEQPPLLATVIEKFLH